MEGSLRLWIISACDIISNINNSYNSYSSYSSHNNRDDYIDKLLIVGRYLFSLEESANVMDLYASISKYFSTSDSGINNMIALLSSSSSSAITIAIEACLIFAVSADSINRFPYITKTLYLLFPLLLGLCLLRASCH